MKINNYYKQYLIKLLKIPQSSNKIRTLFSPTDFNKELIYSISKARFRIYIVLLYFDCDRSGRLILDTLYKAKKNYYNLDIVIIVDLNRAKRNRFGNTNKVTNIDWYYYIAQINSDIEIPIYGIPISNREYLGVFHLKGFIIDNKVIYSGANINDIYLEKLNYCRYDRYKIIKNKLLADTLVYYIQQYLLTAKAISRLNNINSKNIIVNNNIFTLRKTLRTANYHYLGTINYNKLSIVPLVGLGKYNLLNKTIYHLIYSAQKKIILCTPYFNIPNVLLNSIVDVLNLGITVEIIVSDKTASDFYVPKKNDNFHITNIIPYLYEINLRDIMIKLQNYIDHGDLIIKIWKNQYNSFHMKGIWIDNDWCMLTSNNLNIRSWQLDLENALLIYDPQHFLTKENEIELNNINNYTKLIKHYNDIQIIADYPIKIRNLINKIRKINFDKIIKFLI
ncbi:MAG: CDP-diacylglycerol--serine O-phosphatidyltransferase [Candidatus Lightella neohaematopini]|nr:CDP-diacylglycerol--serine O-phosphatidyltransferase [Candidatus Lightella neohaematopini]